MLSVTTRDKVRRATATLLSRLRRDARKTKSPFFKLFRPCIFEFNLNSGAAGGQIPERNCQNQES